MKRLLLLSRGGFSLIEVVLAVGIAAFILTGLLATFPAGLRVEQASQHETRAAQFAKAVLGALQSAPFREANCFGVVLDLASLDSEVEAAAEVVFFGHLLDTGEARIVQASEDESEYKIGLRFAPLRRAGHIESTTVGVAVTPLDRPDSPYYFSTVVGNFGGRD